MLADAKTREHLSLNGIHTSMDGHTNGFGRLGVRHGRTSWGQNGDTSKVRHWLQNQSELSGRLDPMYTL